MPDDSLAPIILAGDLAVIDTTQTTLDTFGEIYAANRDGAVALWVLDQSGDALAGPRGTVYLHALAEPFRSQGPVKPDQVEVVGLVVGLHDPARRILGEGELILARRAEYWWWTQSKAIHHLRRADAPEGSPEYHEFELRFAAAFARDGAVEPLIMKAIPSTAAQLVAQIRTFWDVYGPTDDVMDWEHHLLTRTVKLLGEPPLDPTPLPARRRERFGHLLETGRPEPVSWDEAPTPHPDAELIELDSDLTAARDAFDRIEKSFDEGWTKDRSNAEGEASSRVADLENRIIATPALTHEGLAIKRRVAEHLLDNTDFDFDWTEPAIRSLFDDAERFAGTASLVDTDDPFVKLWSERVAKKAAREEFARHYQAAYETADEEERARLDDADEEAYEQFANTWDKIAATRAETVFGVLVKLRTFADIDSTHFDDDAWATDSRLLKGVMADLERLVGAIQ